MSQVMEIKQSTYHTTPCLNKCMFCGSKEVTATGKIEKELTEGTQMFVWECNSCTNSHANFQQQPWEHPPSPPHLGDDTIDPQEDDKHDTSLEYAVGEDSHRSWRHYLESDNDSSDSEAGTPAKPKPISPLPTDQSEEVRYKVDEGLLDKYRRMYWGDKFSMMCDTGALINILGVGFAPRRLDPEEEDDGSSDILDRIKSKILELQDRKLETRRALSFIKSLRDSDRPDEDDGYASVDEPPVANTIRHGGSGCTDDREKVGVYSRKREGSPTCTEFSPKKARPQSASTGPQHHLNQMEIEG